MLVCALKKKRVSVVSYHISVEDVSELFGRDRPSAAGSERLDAGVVHQNIQTTATKLSGDLHNSLLDAFRVAYRGNNMASAVRVGAKQLR